MHHLIALLSSAVVAAVVSGIFAYVQSVRIERLKSALNESIESKKIDWALTAKISEIGYSRLHERQFEVFRNVYALLVKAHQAFHNHLKPYKLSNERSDEAKNKAVSDAAIALQDFLTENGVFLPRELSERIDEINKEFLNAWLGMGMEQHDFQIYRKAAEDYSNKVPPLIEAVRDEVQRRLGVIR